MYGWVNKYVGIPFVSGGRDENGCDCYGLIRLILKNEYGADLPVLSGSYTNALDAAETKKLFLEKVPLLTGGRIEKPQAGAVALLRSRGLLCHVGLYAGDDYIIHARSGCGAVLERVTSPSISARVVGWWKIDPGYFSGESLLGGTGRNQTRETSRL